MSNKRWFLPLLLILTLLLVACGGAAPAATPAPEATTAASGQGGDDTDNTEPTRAAAPTEAPADEPTEAAEPTEEPEADDGDDGANAPEGGSIETAEDIETYRFRAEITVEGDAFAEDADMAMFSGGITIEGAFIKEPPASDVAMTIPGLGEVGFREVDGEAYTNFGGEWVSASPDEALDVDDLAPVASDDLVDDLDRMERVGEEEVNGRNTVHYTADKELLQEISEESDDDSFNFADAEEAQLDVWLDEEYGFVVRMELVAEGAGLNDDNPDAEGRVLLTGTLLRAIGDKSCNAIGMVRFAFYNCT